LQQLNPPQENLPEEQFLKALVKRQARAVCLALAEESLHDKAYKVQYFLVVSRLEK